MEIEKTQRLAKVFSLMKSTALFGLIVAVSVNFALAVLQPSSKVDAKKLPSQHTWIWWRTQELLDQKSPPPVILLGSSLMMIPVSMQDAEFLNKPLDASKHWQSVYMQTRLSEQLSDSMGVQGNEYPAGDSQAIVGATPCVARSDSYAARLNMTAPDRDGRHRVSPLHNLEGNSLDILPDVKKRYSPDTLSNVANSTDNANAPACFNFAMPGAAISDDYMIVRTLLQGKHKPKVIVLGITLRDFVDSHLSCAAATDVFKYLSRFQPVDDLVALSMPQVWQRLDYALDKSFWLIGSRLDLQVELADLVKDKIKPAGLPLIPHDEPGNTANIANNLKAVVEPGMFILKPGDSSTYEDNTQEYRARFKAVSQANFANQEKFLQRLFSLATEDGITVVLANMPLTRENMALMPVGSYAAYLKTVKDLAADFHINFIDLNDGHTFTKSDFKDTAHMNAHGGQKLIDILTQTIAANQDLAQTLTKPNGNTLFAAGKDKSL